jgi:histidinol-phosphate aminotransferase
MKSKNAKSFGALVRPQVSHFEPYVPGRSMESVRRERGLSKIIKLASNENPLGPSSKALAAIAAVGKSLFRYPDGASTALRETLAEQMDLPVSQVIIGAGSDELIELLGKTFLNPGDSIVVSEHAFLRYRMAAELMGAETITVPMHGFSHDLEAMSKAVRPDTKILFIANPNNPTGTYNNNRELEAFLREIQRQEKERPNPLLVVVDEAYYEFAKVLASDYPDTLALQRRFANLMILRTFSKVHALAGLRVGYGMAAPELIAAIDRVRPPFNVSSAGQAAAQASALDSRQVRRGVELVTSARQQLLPALSRLGIRVVPSAGNFFLMDVSPRRGVEVFESLLKRGIIVRSMDEYGFPQHIRVTYGLTQENKAFLKALTEVLSA